jgi:hypothetical protein
MLQCTVTCSLYCLKTVMLQCTVTCSLYCPKTTVAMLQCCSVLRLEETNTTPNSSGLCDIGDGAQVRSHKTLWRTYSSWTSQAIPNLTQVLNYLRASTVSHYHANTPPPSTNWLPCRPFGRLAVHYDTATPQCYATVVDYVPAGPDYCATCLYGTWLTWTWTYG